MKPLRQRCLLEVAFRTKKLEKCYLNHVQAARMWGPQVARKYVQRIDILQEASSLKQIESFPGLECHLLKGRRSGQYAITLQDRWRLIFRLRGEQTTVILVEEVKKHYGD